MKRILILVALLAFGTATSAHEFVETDHVEMPDLDPSQTAQSRLGEELAIAGNQVLVAASNAFGAEGAVYAFDLTTDGQLQSRGRLPVPGETYQFGRQLAADGGYAVASEFGPVHLFARNGAGTWALTQTLTANEVPEPSHVDIRGLRGDLAMAGNLLAIGDTSAHVQHGGGQVNNAGAVVLYRRGGNGQWNFEAIVTSPTPTSSGSFGDALAVSGNTLLVGASHENKAHVFERVGGQWQLAKTLQSTIDGDYGWSVAVSGDLAVVGQNDGAIVPGTSNNGSFFAYERNLGGSGQWGLRGEYISSVATYIDNFSASLAMRGKVLLVGAPGNSAHAAVFFVHRDDSGWEEVTVLDLAEAHPGVGNVNFGAAVAFNGLRAVIGAPSFPDQSAGTQRWGSVHVWSSTSGGGAVGGLCGGDNPFDTLFCDGFESGQ